MASFRRGLALFILLAVSVVLLLQSGPTSDPAGQLAYIGVDGNVFVVTADLSQTTQVTSDATVRIEGTGRSYHRLIWSPAGQLAFAAVERSRTSTASTLYVTDFSAPPLQLGHSTEHFVIYVSWSPGSCNQISCQRLAYLIEEENEQIALRLVDINGSTAENRRIGLHWPFYFSWSADDSRMLWHVGGGRLDNSAAAYYEYDLRTGVGHSLALRPGLQLAPAFSPHTAEYLVTTSSWELNRASAGPTILIANNNGSEFGFTWSPDGQKIAYASRPTRNAEHFGPIMIYSTSSEQATPITAVGLQPEAFFWSPDSQKIAYLHRLVVHNDIWLQWRVVNLVTMTETSFDPFIPTPQMRFIVNSFNQYAQSHRLWSPDSRYLVYTERGNDLDDTIWLLDTVASDRMPIEIAKGSLAVWSWQ